MILVVITIVMTILFVIASIAIVIFIILSNVTIRCYWCRYYDLFLSHGPDDFEYDHDSDHHDHHEHDDDDACHCDFYYCCFPYGGHHGFHYYFMLTIIAFAMP